MTAPPRFYGWPCAAVANRQVIDSKNPEAKAVKAERNAESIDLSACLSATFCKAKSGEISPADPRAHQTSSRDEFRSSWMRERLWKQGRKIITGF